MAMTIALGKYDKSKINMGFLLGTMLDLRECVDIYRTWQNAKYDSGFTGTTPWRGTISVWTTIVLGLTTWRDAFLGAVLSVLRVHTL